MCTTAKWLGILWALAVPATMHAQKKSLHAQSVFIDTHNDFPSKSIEDQLTLGMDLRGKAHTDLARLQSGGVDVQVWSIWCDGETQQPFDRANREIDSVHAWAERYADKMVLARNSADISKALKANKIASMIGVEGGHMMEDDLTKLQVLYDRGARYMTLTWNNSTPWASSAADETNPDYKGPKGLSSFGREVVAKMNELGMLIDLSHVGEQTAKDVLAITKKPVLVSHSCAYAFSPVRRNLKDEQIKAIAANGGVIHLNFYAGFLDSVYTKGEAAFWERHKEERDALVAANPQRDKDYVNMQIIEKYRSEMEAVQPSLEKIIDHIDYIVKLVGVDHVGLGSDFDGISMAPKGLNGVEDFPKITEALQKRGYNKKEIEKILGGNFLRLLAANEKPH